MNGGVRRGRDLGDLAQQFHVRRIVVEIVVAHDAAERGPAELAVFLFVDLLEDRALVPGRALELLEGLVQVLLGDVHHADLQRLIGLGVAHQVVQPPPGALEPLVVLVMDDLVDLLGQFLVDRGDDRFDAPHGVVGNQRCPLQGLGGEGLDRVFDGLPRLVGLRLELFRQQRRKIAGFQGLPSGSALLAFGVTLSHCRTP